MKYSIRYLSIDKSDISTEKETTIEANDRSAALSILRKRERGCLVRNAIVKEIEEEQEVTPREKCDICNTPLNDGGTCPKCADGEERYNESFHGGTVTPEEFFGMVCSAEDDKVIEVLKRDMAPKELYHRFGKDHSYIMGAIRNGNWSTAKILLAFGVEFAPNEAAELAYMLIREKLG